MRGSHHQLRDTATWCTAAHVDMVWRHD